MNRHSAPAKPDVRIGAALEPIFQDFLKIQRQQIAAMHHALALRDSQTLIRLAHAVRGATATYQLPVAADIARDVELSAAENDLETTAKSIRSLKHYLDTLTVRFIRSNDASA